MRNDLNRKDPYARLLKKEKIPVGSEHFVLQEYRWLDFSTDRLIFTDNTRASVIQNDLHDPLEISEKVTVPKSFLTRFRAPTQPLFPIDLSADYRKFVIETRQRRKRRNFDDDDTSTIDFSEISTPPDLEGRMSKWRARGKSDDQNKETDAGSAHAPQAAPATHRVSAPQSETAAEAALRAESASSQADSLAQLATQPQVSSNEGRRAMRPASDISQAARDRILASLNARTAIAEETKSGSISETLSDQETSFLEQLAAQQHGSMEEDLKTDADASDSLVTESGMHMQGSDQNRPDNATSGHEPATEQIKKEMYDQGYQAATANFKELHSALEQASKELVSLRQKVMLEGREIFLEVLKLSTENILRRQLAVNDESLQALFESALENLHQARKIAVSCSSQTLAKLKAQYAEANLPFDTVEWIVNDSMPVGDIKIATKDEVIKVDLAQLVKKQIASFADELFLTEDDKQALHDNKLKGEAG